MKRVVILSAIVALVGLSGFYESPIEKGTLATSTEITSCGSSVNFNSSVTDFVPAPGPVMTRKDVYLLTPAEINSIKVGIAVMKALPFDDKTSWIYQAAIHGTTRTENLPSWNTCHKPGDAFFFLAWHRMYVYFFERILRAKSGDPDLALPYWNYQSNPAIPPAFRDNAVWNPLYDGSRNATMNSGGALSPSIMTAITNSMTAIPYYDFQSQLNGPHGSVHVSIGGNMRSTSSAALDPVFWLHHGNIDRLWEEWLRKCGGRANPIDNQWLSKSYTFFDETGTAISMTGSQIVNTVTQLNYRYDFPLMLACNIRPPRFFPYNRWMLLSSSQPLILKDNMAKVPFAASKAADLNKFMSSQKKKKLSFLEAESPDRFIIELRGVRLNKAPEGVIEVYLNLPTSEQPDPESKSFVGLVDLFEAEHAGHGQANTVLELDASRAANQLGLEIAAFRKAEITFYVRGNSLNDKEVRTSCDLSIQSIALTADVAKKN